jgi:integrase/recombinase XerD
LDLLKDLDPHCAESKAARVPQEARWFQRESLKTRNWQKANETMHAWEARGRRGPIMEESGPMIVAGAGARFLKDGRARGLRQPTLYKYRFLLRRLRDFARHRGIRYIAEMDLDNTRAFRNSWPDRNLGASKKVERLRAFFRFCDDSAWIVDNPAKKLGNPKITRSPTLPFSREQVASVLGASLDYPDRSNAPRVRALVLLLRYPGLRIRDAVTLGRERIRTGKLFLFTAKTGTPVWIPLPPFVVEALDAIARHGQYFLWTGESKPKSVVGDWQR